MKPFVLFLLFLCPVSLFGQAGLPDSTFSLDGKLSTSLPDNNGTAKSVTIQTDGRILVGGYANNGTDNDFCVVRYHPDGSPDSSLNSTGIVLIDFSGMDDIATSIGFRASDEKIILGGYTFNGSGFEFALAQYNSDGTPDANFGTDGKVTTPLGSTDFGNALAIQDDGKILLAGYSGQSSNEFAVVRYNLNGTLDSTFNDNGSVVTTVGAGSAIAFGVVIQPDDKIVLAGESFNDSTLRWGAAIVRYLSDGTPDSSFSEDGIAINPAGNLDVTINDVKLQSNGKIVLAGFAGTSTANNNFLLVRYNLDGNIDSTFGTNGLVTTAFSAQNNQITSLLVQPDDKIVVGGSNLTGSADQFALARFEADGNLDPTFGNGGKVSAVIGGNDGINGLAFDADWKIVAAGAAFNGGGFDFAVARYVNDVTTGIGTTSSYNDHLSVSPNPVGDVILLNFTLDKTESVTIQLVDMQGRVMKTFLRNEKTESGNHAKRFLLPAELPAGVYHMVLLSQSGKAAVEIVK